MNNSIYSLKKILGLVRPVRKLSEDQDLNDRPFSDYYQKDGAIDIEVPPAKTKRISSDKDLLSALRTLREQYGLDGNMFLKEVACISNRNVMKKLHSIGGPEMKQDLASTIDDISNIREFSSLKDLPGAHLAKRVRITGSCHCEVGRSLEETWATVVFTLEFKKPSFSMDFGDFSNFTIVPKSTKDASRAYGIMTEIVRWLWITDQGAAFLYELNGFKGRTAEEVWDNDEVEKSEEDDDEDNSGKFSIDDLLRGLGKGPTKTSLEEKKSGKKSEWTTPEKGMEIGPSDDVQDIRNIADFEKAKKYLELHKVDVDELIKNASGFVDYREIKSWHELPGRHFDGYAEDEWYCSYDSNGDEGWWDFKFNLFFDEDTEEGNYHSFVADSVEDAEIVLGVINALVSFLWYTDEGAAYLFKSMGLTGRTAKELVDNGEVFIEDSGGDSDDDSDDEE